MLMLSGCMAVAFGEGGRGAVGGWREVNSVVKVHKAPHFRPGEYVELACNKILGHKLCTWLLSPVPL